MSFLGQTLPWPERLLPGRSLARPGRAYSALPRIWQAVSAGWQRVLSAKDSRVSSKRLRVVDRVLLGDKQFVAVLEFDGQTFLASGGNGVPVSLTPSASLHQNEKKPRALKRGGNRKPPAKANGETPGRIAARKANKPASAGPAAAPKKRAAIQVDAKGASAPSIATRKSTRVRTETSKPRKTPVEQTSKVRSRRAALRTDDSVAGSERNAGLAALRPADKAQAPPAAPVPAANTRAGKPKDSPAERAQIAARSETPVSQLAPKPEAAFREEVKKPLPGAALGSAAKQVKAAPEEAADGETDPRASTAFAALLELRMLASEVFQEIEAHGEKPDGVEVAREPEPPEARKKSSTSTAPHRFRRRFSAFACFLGLVLVPHQTARAAVLPVVRSAPVVLASWSALPGQTLVSAAAVDLLAARAPSGDEIRISGLGGSSASWSIVVVLTLLTLIPSLLFCITPFARLLIVFHFLRQALGLQTTPSNQTLIGLSLILTFFLMQPTGAVIYRDAIVPAQEGKLTPLDAVVRAGGPMRHFMAHYVREKDAELFLEIAKEPRPRSVQDLSFRVLLPAYILSELKAGFQIGTVLFLPFLIVDMVVASITTSVGMMQLPPVVISTPLKLLLFLMVDGWHLLIGALMRSFN